MTEDPGQNLREVARLDALRRAGPWEGAPEESFDRLARLAARALKAPAATLALIDADREYVKGSWGLAGGGGPSRRAPASPFGRQVVRSGRPLAVEEMRGHPLGRDDPGADWVSFLGQPLVTAEGHALGVLAVIDRRPRAWTEHEVETLGDLASAAMGEIAARRDAAALRRSEAELRAARDFAATILQAGEGLVLSLDRAGRVIYLNRAGQEATGYTLAELEGRPFWDVLLGPAEAAEVAKGYDAMLAGAPPRRREDRWRTKGGEERAISWTEAGLTDEAGAIAYVVVTGLDLTDRRRAEARYRRLIDSNVIGVVSGDVSGRVVEANDAFLEMLGYDRADLEQGRLRWDLLTATGHLDRDLRAIEALRSGRRSVLYEKDFVRKDGARVPAYVGAVHLEGTDGLGIAFVLDLSERRRAEEALRANEERYRRLFEANPHPMWIYDVETLRFLAVNDAAVAHYGFSREEFLGMTVDHVRPAEDVPHFRKKVDDLGGRSLLNESGWRHRRKDGTLLDVEISSHPLEFDGRRARLVLISDVTERHRAQEAIRRSEERYRWLVENTTEAIWRFEQDEPCPTGLPEDDQIAWFYRHGYLAECNPAMARMYGYEDASKMIGMRLGEVLDRADPRNEALLRAFIRSGYRLEEAESIGLDRDGLAKFSMNRLVADVEGGHVVRAWGASRDVTEQRRSEEELTRAKDVAEAASRAKDRFLAVLSHELRTPLTPVMLAVTSLLDEDAAPAIRSELETIRRNVELEAHLIDDLLDVSRIVSGNLRLKLEPTDVHQELRRAVEICRAEADAAGLRIELELSAPAHHARADRARLTQIFWNLIRNASRFTTPGGSLTVRTRNEAAGSAGARLVVEFEDTGVGIEPEILPRIFDPFEQGNSALRGRQGGLGLGLAIGRGLAEAHGGRLTASSPGRGLGSTFRLELAAARPAPAPAPAPETAPEAAESSAPRRPGRMKILLVEDNEDTLDFLALVLRHRGHQVATAETLASARPAADADLDLIISDIELPDGTGIDLVRELRSRRSTPAIALSGFGSEEDIRQCREAGFDAHLTKPIDVKQLDAAIRRVLPGSA